MCTLLPWPVGGRGGRGRWREGERGRREGGEGRREGERGGREGEITDQPQPSNL